MIKAGGPAIGTGVASKIVETRTALSFLRKYFAATSDFLAIHKDGPVAFTIAVIVACVVYAVYMSTVLSAMEFGLSLVFQFVLVSWFTLDLRRLDRHLNVNEASEGVIYVYLDAVVMAVYAAMVLIAFAITATICVGLATSHGADELRECGICDEYISCFMCIWRCFAANASGLTASSGMTVFTIATASDSGAAATAVNCYWTTASASASVKNTATATVASLITTTQEFTWIQLYAPQTYNEQVWTK